MLSPSDKPDDPPWWGTMKDLPVVLRNILQQGRDTEMKEKGEAIGFLRGKIRTTQWLLELLLASRFGDVPTPLLKYIYYVRDPERLENAFRQALTLENLQDLRI